MGEGRTLTFSVIIGRRCFWFPQFLMFNSYGKVQPQVMARKCRTWQPGDQSVGSLAPTVTQERKGRELKKVRTRPFALGRIDIVELGPSHAKDAKDAKQDGARIRSCTTPNGGQRGELRITFYFASFAPFARHIAFPTACFRLKNWLPALILLFAVSCATRPSVNDLALGPLVEPMARLETTPVPHGHDAADDPAIWVHPSVPGSSLILGTDKQGALNVYNLDGSVRQTVGEGTQPNNVDVLYGFQWGARLVDLAVATTRGARARGLKIWAIDPQAGQLTDVTAGEVIGLFGGGEPYGCCTYRSRRTGGSFVFVTAKNGQVEQYALHAAAEGKVGARKVRAFRVGSMIEAGVADDEQGVVYFGEESRGIWKFPAEPDAAPLGVLVARVGENGLRADVEGLALYCATEGRGYLIASSQGNNTFKVYERGGTNRFVLTIDPRAGAFGDVQDTDGIAVTSCPTSRDFPRGLFVAQDGDNSPARQNFKLFAWEDIAAAGLLVDTNWSPRPR